MQLVIIIWSFNRGPGALAGIGNIWQQSYSIYFLLHCHALEQHVFLLLFVEFMFLIFNERAGFPSQTSQVGDRYSTFTLSVYRTVRLWNFYAVMKCLLRRDHLKRSWTHSKKVDKNSPFLKTASNALPAKKMATPTKVGPNDQVDTSHAHQ